MTTLLGLAAVLSAFWWALIGLKPYTLSPEAFAAAYAVQAEVPIVQREALPGHAEALQFRSFDGSMVYGRIVYPSDPAQVDKPFPVLLGLHGLGRTHMRWWQGEFRGRPTIEHTHQLTALALRRGYAVIALDARRHGQREPGFAASRLLMDMTLWGQREPYERMVTDTVRDYRLLLNWVQQQTPLDATRVQAAGYSMGAQIALLLAGVDPRVKAVAAIVPPHLDDKVAAVSPRNAFAGLGATRVWLLSADQDEYARPDQSAALFEALPGPEKRHLRFASGHALPAAYVEQLEAWF